MNSGSDVEAFLRAGGARLTTAQATAITTSHLALAAEVASKWSDELRSVFPNGTKSSIAPGRPEVDSAPIATNATLHGQVWVWAPDRSRTEEEDPRGGKSLLIVDQTAWAGWDSFRGVFGGRLPTDPRKQAIEDELNPKHTEIALGLLRPWRLVRGFRVQAVGEDRVAGRRALRFQGVPAFDARTVYESGGDAAPAVFEGAEAARFWIDAERGVLLRWAGLSDGEEYMATEFTTVVFDEPLDARLFDPATAGEWVRGNSA